MRIEAYVSSGNVFADLGLPNPEERLAKAELVVRIKEIMEDQALTLEETAERSGISRPDLSNLLRGSTSSFSLDQLFLALKALGEDIEIHLRPKPANRECARLGVVLEPAAEAEAPEEEQQPQVALAGAR